MKRIIAALTIIIVVAVVFLVQKKLKKSRDFHSQEIIVYGYSSLVSSWGPGPKIAEEFEAVYGAKVRLVDAGDSRMMLKKVEIEGEATPVDVILGIDLHTLADARGFKFGWKKIDIKKPDWNKFLPHKKVFDDNFVPFDWSPLTFIYRKGEIEPPQSLNDLLDPRFEKSISVIDPRTSTPGFIFLWWISKVMGEEKAKNYLTQFEKSIFTVSPSWSQAYGLFTKKHAKVAFSYLTSVAYHWTQDGDRTYQAAVLQDAHPYQIEFAGVPKTCKNCDAAEEFVAFLLTKSSQLKIMNNNYMLPVIDGVTDETVFAELPNITLIDHLPSAEGLEAESLLELWKASAK